MIFFQGFWEINALFKGAQTPPGRPQEHINPYKPGVFFWDIGKLYIPRSDAAKSSI